MTKSGKSFPSRFCAVFSVVAAVAYIPFLVGIRSNGVFAPIERIWHDASFVFRGESLPAGDPRLVLVAVDDETVGAHGFPLPRVKYAQALRKMRELGVKTVVFDVLFFEPREGDAELAAETKRHGGVIHLFNAELKEDGSPKITMAIKPLRDAAQYMGSPVITHHVDNDGHVREFSLFNAALEDPHRKDKPVTSLAAAALASFTGRPIDDLLAEHPADEIPPVLNYRRPTDRPRHEAGAKGENYFSPYRNVSLMDILSGRLSEEQKKALKGSLALVGSVTTGYFDHYPSPFTSHAPGPEYHLNIIDNVLNGDALSGASRLWVLLLVLAAVWLPYGLLRLMPPAAGAAAVAAALAALAGVSYHLQTRGVMFYPVAPGVTLILSFLALTVHRVLTEGAEKAAIKAKFGQFVAPEIVEELAADPEKARLGAQKREMTVFFLDIAHFTTISEKMTAEGLIQFLNKYLSALSTVILDRRGTIDKYIGDCIMAFWNAPLENKDHRLHAILSALECQKAIEVLNKDLDPNLPEVPAIRIGINSGDMNVGFTGTEKKLAYTVLGDEVNLGSRLEGANKFFGSRIIASGAAYEPVRDRVAARYLGKARVVGKETPVPVYEPLAEAGRLEAPWTKALPVWEKAVAEFYAKKYDAALALFEEFVKLVPGDGPGELYLNLSRDYSALPPDDWDQVFNLTAK